LACNYPSPPPDNCFNDTTIIDSVEIGDCNDPAWLLAHPELADLECPPPPCPTPPCDDDTSDVCPDAALIAEENVVIDITGDIQYNGDGPLPICFADGDCAVGDPFTYTGGEPTRVRYHSTAKGIYPAHYGILEIHSDVTTTLNLLGKVYIKGKRSYALDHQGIGDVLTGNYYIAFEEFCADATYANCQGEVVGWIYRTASYPEHEYTYHNKVTTITLDVAPRTAAMPLGTEWFGLLSIPASYLAPDAVGKGLTSLSYAYPPDAALGQGYINRLWQVDFATVVEGTIGNMKLGNLTGEISAELAANWSKLRGYEAYDPKTLPELLGTSSWLVNGDPIGTVPVPTGTPVCSLFTVEQTDPIYLKDDHGNDASEGYGDDIFTGNQIVFGNIPIVIQSVSNGRWSNPTTWSAKKTPSSDDSVIIRHLVYTGIYADGYDVLGVGGWSTNEHDLADVKVTTNNGQEVYQLARYVNILSATEIQNVVDGGSTIGFNANREAGVIIGNHDEDAKNNNKGTGYGNDPSTVGTDAKMNFDKILTFGFIHNKNNVGGNTTSLIIDKTDLTATGNLLSSTTIPNFGGFYVMGNITEGIIGGAAANGTQGAPVVNPYIFYNNGGAIKNEGTIEIGKE